MILPKRKLKSGKKQGILRRKVILRNICGLRSGENGKLTGTSLPGITKCPGSSSM
jgi:hypothetical protein